MKNRMTKHKAAKEKRFWLWMIASTITDYDWSFDAASRTTQYINSVDGTSNYNYDNGNQVTDANYDFQSDEAYDYDENGNRTNTGYTTGFCSTFST